MEREHGVAGVALRERELPPPPAVLTPTSPSLSHLETNPCHLFPQGQWWLFGLGFLCPLLWLVACFAPLVACKVAGSATARAAFHNRSAVIAWSLSFTAALIAAILGSCAAAMLTIASGHGNGAGGLGSEWVFGVVPKGAGVHG